MIAVLRLYALLAFLLLVVTSSLLAGEDALDADADPRLQKEVTVFQIPAPLGAVVKALSQRTGVALQTERSISQYRAILVAEEKPLHEVLRKLAEAFGFKWERKGKQGEPPTYMLYQPPADSARESAELREMERLVEEIWRYTASIAARWTPESKQTMQTHMEERRQTLEDHFKESKVSRAEIIGFLREMYATIWAYQPWTRAAVLAMASLSPAQVRQIREGAVLLVRGDALSPEALRLILNDWRETEAPVPSPTDPNKLQTGKPYRSKPWDNVEVWLFPNTSAGNIQSLVFFTGPDLRYGGQEIHSVTLSPYELYIQINSIVREMLDVHPLDNPLLQKPTHAAEFDRKRHDYLIDPIGMELAHFARANRVCLAAEWYPFSLSGTPEEPAEPFTSWAQAQKRLRDHAAEVGTSGDWVIVRSFARMCVRRTNVSHEQIAQWLLKPRAEGRLSLDDCAQIAFLHELQRRTLRSALWRMHEGKESTGGSLAMIRDTLPDMNRSPRMLFALQGYALLPTAQKRALLNGQPVPLFIMPRQSAARFQIAAILPPAYYEIGESLPPEVSSQMALVLMSRGVEEEEIAWSQVPEEMREPDAFRPWLESLSPQERAKVVRRVTYWHITLSLTDGERAVPLASLSVLQ